MGKETAIEWTHHTFNPWWGCVKIAPECAHCYAATFDHRLGGEHWGPGSERKLASEGYWEQPKKWDADAARAGERRRVFCASMADVFEEHPALGEQRDRLWELIAATPHLDWLLLTKRPENISKMVPAGWLTLPRRNVWYGTTAGTRETWRKNVAALKAIPAAVRFVSVEPLLETLGAIDLTGIHWIIVGGESGAGARAMKPSRVHEIFTQCRAAGVPFFFKQWGEWGPVMSGVGGPYTGEMMKLGKKNAGRVFHGREWDQFPHFANAAVIQP